MSGVLHPLLALVLVLRASTGFADRSIACDPNEMDGDLQVVHADPLDECGDPGDGGGRVSLANLGLTKVPGSFASGSSVRSVSLAGNSLRTVAEDAFAELANATCLSLAGNRLPVMLPLSWRHASLRTLILRGQDRRGQPDFSASPNDLVPVYNPERAPFPSLTTLDLSDNAIRRLPAHFNRSFPRLTHLYLSGSGVDESKLFDSLPASVNNLHLERNWWKDAPGVRSIGNVTSLFLDGSRIDVFEVPAGTLKVLSLANCSLKHLRHIYLSPGLVSLDLSRNQLWEVQPAEFTKITTLRFLSLSRNRFFAVPRLNGVHELLGLSLSYNEIERVDPSAVARFSSLVQLSLRGNRIAAIANDTFAGARMLRHLDLAENELSWLPTGWADSLRDLRVLNLNANRFAAVGDLSIGLDLPLEHLFVKGNPMTEIGQQVLYTLPENVTVHLG